MMLSFRRIVFAAALALTCSLAWAAPFMITGQASGTVNSQTLNVTITPAIEDVGRTGNIYVAAYLPSFGQWYFLTATGWLQWTGGEMPVFASGTLGTLTVRALENMDISWIPGAAIYGGYGSSSAAMLANGTYALVFVAGRSLPSISGTASAGTWSAPDVAVYGLKGDGSRGLLLGTTTADNDGHFALTFGAVPEGAVEIVVAGGTYVSPHDGATRPRRFPMSTLLPSVSGSLGNVAVTPVTDFVAQRARELLLSGLTPAEAVNTATQAIETIYGLPSGASSLVPRFDAAAITQAPAAAQVGLLVGAIESLGARVFPVAPDVAAAVLAVDFGDGILNGMAASLPITVDRAPIATDLGTFGLLTSAVHYASAYASGLLPAFAAPVTPTYASRTIPVYVAQTIPSYRNGVPATYTANPTPLTPNTRGPSSIGQHSCTGGATISHQNGNYSCSDGSIPMFTAQPIQPYTAGMVLPFEAAVVGQDVPAGTVPVYTSVTDIHLFTEAERNDMFISMVASRTSYPGGGALAQGPLTQAQLDAYAVLNHNIQVWYSGSPFR